MILRLSHLSVLSIGYSNGTPNGPRPTASCTEHDLLSVSWRMMMAVMLALCALGSALLHGGRSVQGAPLADAWRFELVS